jgi:CheY-like chemotaxis protein
MSAAESGATINRRLLSFARRQMLNPQHLNLNDRVVEMHHLLRPSLGEKITLAIHSDPELWSTIGDPGEVDSAIVNLAINSRDAMQDGGALTITTRNITFDEVQAHRLNVPPGQYVSISVADTGHGMPPEILDRALEPFFTTKETAKGSGLGLSSVYGFLRQSGGSMDINSEVGIGTVVHMYLPRAATNVPEVASAIDADDRRANGELILVVEDNDRVREVVRMNLQSLGYRVIEASNALDAKTILTSTKGIQLVFSDVVMPGEMNGYDLADWIQMEKPAIKVLLASGYNELTLDKGLRSNVRLLGKPYRRSQFAQALNELLRGD